MAGKKCFNCSKLTMFKINEKGDRECSSCGAKMILSEIKEKKEYKKCPLCGQRTFEEFDYDKEELDKAIENKLTVVTHMCLTCGAIGGFNLSMDYMKNENGEKVKHTSQVLHRDVLTDISGNKIIVSICTDNTGIYDIVISDDNYYKVVLSPDMVSRVFRHINTYFRDNNKLKAKGGES